MDQKLDSSFEVSQEDNFKFDISNLKWHIEAPDPNSAEVRKNIRDMTEYLRKIPHINSILKDIFIKNPPYESVWSESVRITEDIPFWDYKLTVNQNHKVYNKNKKWIRISSMRFKKGSDTVRFSYGDHAELFFNWKSIASANIHNNKDLNHLNVNTALFVEISEKFKNKIIAFYETSKSSSTLTPDELKKLKDF